MKLSVQSTAGNQATRVPDPFGFGKGRPSSPSFSFASSVPETDGDLFDIAHRTPIRTLPVLKPFFAQPVTCPYYLLLLYFLRDSQALQLWTSDEGCPP